MAAPVNLAALVRTVTPDEALATELAVASALSLPTTAWQPLGVTRGILGVNSQIVSDYSVNVNDIAQGGYASYAALMVDAKGVEITTWMDLISTDNYKVTRIPASYAVTDATGFSATNSTGTTYGPYQPGQFHVANPLTKASYVNTAVVSIGPGTTNFGVIADVVGAGSTSGAGAIIELLTPLIGVTVSNSKALVGSDQESNKLLLKRCQTKLGALSPDGPSAAYYFVATSILDPLQPFYNPAVVSKITRCSVVSNPGEVDVYVANAAGAVHGVAELGVSNASNTNPIIITTVAAHGLSDGDTVITKGIQGNTNANGTWTIAAASGSVLTLVGAVGNAGYTGGGTLEGGDLGLIDAAIQLNVVPDGVTAVVQSATPVTINFVYTIYIPKSSGYTALEVTTAVSDAVATYLEGLDIGGVTDANPNRVPYTALVRVVGSALPKITSIALSVTSLAPLAPNGDVILTQTEVPVQGTPTGTVVFT